MYFCKAEDSWSNGYIPRAMAYRCWTCSSNILVRNNLNALDMARGFENLLQHFLGDSRIQPPNIQCSLVRLWRSSTYKASSTGRRHHLLAIHWRPEGCRYRIGVLGDAQGSDWGRRHMRSLAIIVVARGARRIWWSTGAGLGSLIGHF
jgi:hypothetical protein